MVVSDIKYTKPVSKGSDLQRLADDLEMAQATLDNLGMSSETEKRRTILDVLKWHKPYIYNKWKRKALGRKEINDSYPNSSKFVDIMSQIARESNDPVYGAYSVYMSKCSHFDVTFRGNNNCLRSAGVSRRPYVVCKQFRCLFTCSVFKRKYPRMRFEIVK